MNWLESIVLGIVEGLTEYLPVSSTGHLLLTQRVLGIPESEASNAFAVCIQAGAIVAVLGLYWARVKQTLVGLCGKLNLGNGDQDGFRLLVNLIVAFLPAAVIGLLFDDKIEELLFGLRPIVGAWFIGGIAILAVAWYRRRRESTRDGKPLEQMTWGAALAIGFIQCIAMCPGTSRSLVTIVGGVMVGMSLSAAVEFSFLLGVITLLAATAYKSIDAGPIMLAAYGWTPMIIGSIAAWASAVAAIKWMVDYLKRHGMEIFGYYRVVLAVVVACLMYQGTVVESSQQSEVDSQQEAVEQSDGGSTAMSRR
ncbi:MAG: undecaprenyl-diphosphate phosphatase [Planctomycetales bacterium]|nr:undecaprenyl-diphosphate phosphatase [Planctomycetales bacterium]